MSHLSRAIDATLVMSTGHDLSMSKARLVASRWLASEGLPVPAASEFGRTLDAMGIEQCEAPYGMALRGVDISPAAYRRFMARKG